ncbi:hypothetical protein XELAEV_18028646mg [Xenopus laevis]|uniref:Uncharacterized protein n=1 Tax=Xenopus laevis TaxID=8355 RepID=A0A974HGV7_XENLA|nr:hypothetical protein XELAEV_18028646mg [Xenopus laevis]
MGTARGSHLKKSLPWSTWSQQCGLTQELKVAIDAKIRLFGDIAKRAYLSPDMPLTSMAISGVYRLRWSPAGSVGSKSNLSALPGLTQNQPIGNNYLLPVKSISQAAS